MSPATEKLKGVRKVFFAGNGVCMKRGLDVQRIQDYFKANGCEVVEAPAGADLIVVATCAFLNGYARAAHELLDEYSGYHARVLVYGCLPDMDKTRFQARGNRYWIETRNIERFGDLFPEFTVPFSSIPDAFIPHAACTAQRDSEKQRKQSVVPYLRTGYGCLGACAYCSHPMAVGRLRSKPLAECVEDYKRILAEGHRTICIHSGDPGAYGMDIKSSLPELLEALYDADPSPDLTWYLPDVNPRWLARNEATIRSFIERGRLRGLGVPLQSGSDRVLKLMRRPSNVGETIRILKSFQSELPAFGLYGHFIVGFPGETEEDFNETLRVCADLKYQSVLVFKYSDTEGTASSTFQPKVPRDVIDRRTAAVKAILDKIAKEVVVYE
jgi:MiaB/RimO family radical SAM methylthiotransferase